MWVTNVSFFGGMCNGLDDGASSSDTGRVDKGGGQNCRDVCTGKIPAAGTREATGTGGTGGTGVRWINMARDLLSGCLKKKMKFIFMCLLTASAIELTPENWEDETVGKTVFIKMFAPWVSVLRVCSPCVFSLHVF